MTILTNIIQNNIKKNKHLTLVENAIITFSLIEDSDFTFHNTFKHILKKETHSPISELMLSFLYICHYYEPLSHIYFIHKLREQHPNLFCDISKKDKVNNFNLFRTRKELKEPTNNTPLNVISDQCESFIFNLKKENKNIKESEVGLALSQYVDYKNYNINDFFEVCKHYLRLSDFENLLHFSYALKQCHEGFFVKLLYFISETDPNTYNLLKTTDKEIFDFL